MRLGLALGVGGAPGSAGRDLDVAAALVAEAERLGFDSCWVPEAFGCDAPTVLAWLAAQTVRIGLGSAVMQIPARSAAMTAMTTMTLDRLSGGRFRLGLGVSGPQVSEGWHGVPFDHPLARTRRYLEAVRAVLRGEPVPQAGPGTGVVRLSERPLRVRPPIYLAAVGPRNVQLAGEVADGWLAVLFAPSHAGFQLDRLDAGVAAAGRRRSDVEVVATVPLAVGADVAECADRVRPHVALYLGGMGSREHNFYADHARRMGFAAEVDRAQDLFLAGRHREAAAAVPFGIIDETSLLGPPPRLAERLAAFAEAGVDVLCVAPLAPDVGSRLAALRAVAAAGSPAARYLA